MKYRIRITGQSGEPYVLPGSHEKADAERSARFYNALDVTAEVIPDDESAS